MWLQKGMCSGQLYLYPELSQVHQVVQANFLCKSTTRKDDDYTTDLHNDSDDSDDDDDESDDSETKRLLLISVCINYKGSLLHPDW